MDDEAIYRHLVHLTEAMPAQFEVPLSSEDLKWLGQAAALVEEVGDLADKIAFSAATQKMGRYPINSHNAGSEDVRILVYRALAKAELRAPAAVRGSFVPTGHQFDAFVALGKVLARARDDVMIVDPYLDATCLSDFCPLVADGVQIRLLSDEAGTKQSFGPAVARWKQQYGASKPLEAKLAASRALHDRLILIDDSEAWLLTQSLKDFAARSPGSISLADSEASALKVDHYNGAWNVARSI